MSFSGFFFPSLNPNLDLSLDLFLTFFFPSSPLKTFQQILPAISSLLEESAHLVILVKPQFEAGKAQVGSGGVVRDEKVRKEVLAAVVAAVPEAAQFSVSCPYDAAPGGEGEEGEEDEEEEGEGDKGTVAAAASPSSSNSNQKTLLLPPRFVLQGTMESPIRGATSGNVEYLAHFRRG